MIDLVDTRATVSDPWFVIWAESRAEKKVAQRMAAMGLEPWLPIIKERHRWSDRWKKVECPLFPGYLFARATNADWPRILRTPGVLTVVREGGKPALLTGSFVMSLREAIERDGIVLEAVAERADYVPGDEVIVQDGPLVGLRGVVKQVRNRRQLIVWIEQIGRGVAFTIEAALVLRPPEPSSR